MPDAGTLNAFYRWTDINFEWSKTIADPAEQSALKAFLAPDCLTSPQNPLYDHSEGGFTLHHGTRKDGEARLLYSLKQIEYIRYWLHQMGLTKKPLSLPNSTYLLTHDDFDSIPTHTYKTSKELKDAQKTLQKNNKRLKGMSTDTTVLRKQFESVRAAFQLKRGQWLALDFESWEGSWKTVTEFGFSKLTWHGGKEHIEDGHTMPDRNIGYRNGQYVPDEHANFQYGETRIVPYAQWTDEILNMITQAAAQGPVFLIFHNKTGDIKCDQAFMASKRTLEMLGLPHETIQKDFPDKPPESGVFALDTQPLFRALSGGNEAKLRDMCVRLGFNHFTHFHNAGNDAHYTLEALKAMASGPTLDAQREARWPTWIDPENKVKVNFPTESDSEDEDSEDEDGLEGWLQGGAAKSAV
ncbi:hypothetical protein BKA62DRAFT_813534 [Auriculariales sp. MPI-PUGE-AT-0066]|nr:hypothetical protein BKA62DRAFT_813534 [Auriculariales sp. MPI-PUGE-AT-0066]